MSIVLAPARLGLIILLTLSCPSWAQASFAQLDHLEREASASYIGFDLDQFEKSFKQLRSEYQRLNKPQEEVWALYAFDFDQEAKRLETELRLRLLTEEIVEEKSLPLGRATVRAAKLESGLWVVLRERVDHQFGPNVRLDVLTYELSRTLGFHLVPVTVLRPYKNSVASLQVMIRDSKPGNESFIFNDYQDQKLHILDYLTGQLDRHQGNWLIAPGGRVVAIDNDIMYGNDMYAHARQKLGPDVSSDHPPQKLSSENRRAVERFERKLIEESDRFQLRPMELTFIRSRIQTLLGSGRTCEGMLK